MVLFGKYSGDGIRGRVVVVSVDEGTLRVLTENGVTDLKLSKCLAPVKFHDGIVYYDDADCPGEIRPNVTLRIFADGHWVTQESLDHALVVDTRDLD